MSYPLHCTPSAAHQNSVSDGVKRTKQVSTGKDAGNMAVTSTSVKKNTPAGTATSSTTTTTASAGTSTSTATHTGTLDSSASKGISKLKLFSKFSFAKQSPPQHKIRPTQSILSNSLKEQQQQQQQQKQKQKQQPRQENGGADASSKPSSSRVHGIKSTETGKIGFNSPASSLSKTIHINVSEVSTSTDEGKSTPHTPSATEPESKAETSTLNSTAKTGPATTATRISANASSSSLASNMQRMTVDPTPKYSSPLGTLLLDSDSEDEMDDKKLKSEEALKDYCPGGYHPTYIGEKYGRNEEYLIVRKLGWGHFSTVWLAWDSANSRHVAIKIVRSSANYSEAAMDEITLLEKVNSGTESHEGKKHVVQLLDHFFHEGPNGKHVCMIFEVLGENMLNLLIRYKDFQSHREKEIDEVIKNGENEKRMEVHLSNIHDLHILSESYGGLPLTLVKQISKQILLALDYLHRECGIIHTDIKPENILVEIHDVEKLVQLLEFERKSKKLSKILEKRHNDHSYCLQRTASYTIGQAQLGLTTTTNSNLTTAANARTNINNSNNSNNINNNPNRNTNSNTNNTNNSTTISITGNNSNNNNNSRINLNNINTITSSQRFSNNHSYHSLSRSISIQKSLTNNNANTNSNNSGISIGTPIRKNSIPIRSSKPLTSPVENSSVDNFFRSFSFSQKRTPSFSGSVHNSNTNLITDNSISNANNVSPILNQHSSSERHSSIVSNISQPRYTASILSSPGYKKADIDIIDGKGDEDGNKSKKILGSSINDLVEEEEEEEEDDDIFVDATEPILSISPHIKERPVETCKQKPKHKSTGSIETIQPTPTSRNGGTFDNTLDTHGSASNSVLNVSVGQNLVPFPSPIVPKHSRKPSLSIDTSSSDNEIDKTKRESSTVSASSRPSILNEFEEIISVKIADLGNACWYNKHYTPDIQTRQYRSPEVILGGDWGCSADIWSAACVIFELITSDYLFDPKSSASYSRNDDHLAQIVELLQTWPSKDYLRTCSRWREFFDRSGQNFRKIGKLKIWPLRMVLIDEYKMSEALATEVSDFLLPMLEFIPAKRVDAGSMCAHPWIKDVSCGTDLGRKYGLHGDGIKGWSEEWED